MGVKDAISFTSLHVCAPPHVGPQCVYVSEEVGKIRKITHSVHILLAANWRVAHVPFPRPDAVVPSL